MCERRGGEIAEVGIPWANKAKVDPVIFMMRVFVAGDLGAEGNSMAQTAQGRRWPHSVCHNNTELHLILES